MVLVSHRKERYQMCSIVAYFLLTIAICSSPCSPITLTPEFLDKPRCLNLTTKSRANQTYWGENRFSILHGNCLPLCYNPLFKTDRGKRTRYVFIPVLYHWFEPQLRAAVTRSKQVAVLLSHTELSGLLARGSDYELQGAYGELASALSSTDGPNQVEKWEVRERTAANPAKSKLAWQPQLYKMRCHSCTNTRQLQPRSSSFW